MDHSAEQLPERLLAEARAGCRDSLGILLERYRAYLRALACSRIHVPLQARANASDLVQETFLLASRKFEQFRGNSEGEWLHWLRMILRRRLSQVIRKHVTARKRTVCREIPIGRDPGSSVHPGEWPQPLIVDHGSSPSTSAQRRELAHLMAERLGQLRPAYREVLVLRNLKGLSFDEIAQRMQRSPGGVRVLWLRALEQLRRLRFGEDLL